MAILDFRFWILDVRRLANPQSAIRGPEVQTYQPAKRFKKNVQQTLVCCISAACRPILSSGCEKTATIAQTEVCCTPFSHSANQIHTCYTPLLLYFWI